MQRLRLELSEALLTPAIRAQGLARCWYCPSSAAVTIADFTREIHAHLRLDCAVELRLVLSGFTLPPDGPVGLLRDGDLIAVQKLAQPSARTLQLPSVAQAEGVAAAQGQGANLVNANAAVGDSRGGGGGSKRKRHIAAGAAVNDAFVGSGGAGDAPPQDGADRVEDLKQGQEYHVHKARRMAAAAGLATAEDVNATPGAATGGGAGEAQPDAFGGDGMFVCGNEGAAAARLSQRAGELDATPETGTDGAGAATGEKKRASRSARRKANKRRLCREGVLPYKGAGRGKGAGGTGPRQQVPAGGRENLAIKQRMVDKKAQEQQQQQHPEQQRIQQPVEQRPLQQQQEGQTSAMLAAALAASPLDPNGTLPGAAGLNSNYAHYAAASGAAVNGSVAAAIGSGTAAAAEGPGAAAAPAQQQRLEPEQQKHKPQQQRKQQQRTAPVRGMATYCGSVGAGPSGARRPAAAAAAGGAVHGRATAVRWLCSSRSSSSTEGTSYSSDDSDDDSSSNDDDDGGGKDVGAAEKRTSAAAIVGGRPAAAAAGTTQQGRKQGNAQEAGVGVASTSSSGSSSDDSDDDDSDDEDEDGGAEPGGQKKVPPGTSKAVSAAAPAKATRARTAALPGSKSSSSDEEENEEDSSSDEDSSSSSDDETSSEEEEKEEKPIPVPVNAAGRPEAPSQAGVAERTITTTTPIDYDSLPVAHGNVEVGDVLAYKLLEIGLDMCPRVSDWRQSRVIAVDTVAGSVVLEPHPDPRVHPLQAELNALRARLAAESAAGEGDAAADAAVDVRGVELDWEALPFPTDYDAAGLLRLALDRLGDARIVSAATTAAAPALAVTHVSAPAPTPVANTRAAVDAKPVSMPTTTGAGVAAVPCSGANRHAGVTRPAGAQGGVPAALTPMRQDPPPGARPPGKEGPGLPSGTRSRPATPRPSSGTPCTSVKRPPPPPQQQQQLQSQSRPGTPVVKTSTVGTTVIMTRPRALMMATEAAATASAPGSIVPAVGGWAVIAEELRQKRLELGTRASTPSVSQVPDNVIISRQQQRQQQQLGRLNQVQSQPTAQPQRLSGLTRPGSSGTSSGAGAACGATPPSIPEVTIPGFRSKGGANGVGRGRTESPGSQGVGCKAEAPVQAGLQRGGVLESSAIDAEAGGSSDNASGKNRAEGAAGVETPGAAKPRGGARRIAMGPMLSYLRSSGGL